MYPLSRALVATLTLASLGPLVACGGVDQPAGAIDQTGQSLSTIASFNARQDLRLRAGGFVVAQSGSRSTTCADGTVAVNQSCYVATFDWGALNLTPSREDWLNQQALAGRLRLRGEIVPFWRKGEGNVGQLVVLGYEVVGYVWGPHGVAMYPHVGGWRPAPTGY